MNHRIAVVGPTATGKSDLAIGLAQAFDGEVVNADASQLYRGMDIGTAKVSIAERKKVPHHQIDVLDVTEDATLAAYQREALRDIASVEQRGKTVIVAGGSGLYVNGLLNDLDLPATDPEVRLALEARAEIEGTPALYAELLQRDPVSARKILPGNTRRIVRALEVMDITGQPFSAHLPELKYRVPTIQIGLHLDRALVHERINERVNHMVEAGLVDEVRALMGQGLERGTTARRAIGYAQVMAALRGDITMEQAITDTQTATRRLVRKQDGWFKRDQRVIWLPALAEDLLDRAIERVRTLTGQ